MLAPELGEGLELVDELVNNLPEPLVGQLQVHGLLGREDVVEQLAVIVVGLEPVMENILLSLSFQSFHQFQKPYL